MSYPNSVKMEVFTFYCNGLTAEAISKIFNGKPSNVIILRWARDGDWTSKKEKIYKSALAKSSDNLSNIKSRQLSLMRAVIGKYAQLLNKDLVDIKTSDINNIMKHEWLISGGNTEKTELVGEGVITHEDFAKVYDDAKRKVPESDK